MSRTELIGVRMGRDDRWGNHYARFNHKRFDIVRDPNRGAEIDREMLASLERISRKASGSIPEDAITVEK